MAADDELAGRVRAALGHARLVEEKRMFGGLAFMVNGKMCLTVGRDRIMCRIDPTMHAAAVQRHGCRAVVMNGREYRGYVHVDADALRTGRELRYWVDLALEYNGRVKASPRKRRRSRIDQEPARSRRKQEA